MIRKLKSGEYRLYSHTKDPQTGTRRILGTFVSREEAKRHMRATELAAWRSRHLMAAAVLGSLVLVGLSFGVFLLLNPDLLSDSPAPQNTAIDPKHLGWLSLSLALFMAGALGYTSARGYVYCGRTEWVTKANEPQLYRAWFLVHLGLILTIVALSLSMLRAF